MLRIFLKWRIKKGTNTYKYFHRQVQVFFGMPVIFRMTNIEVAYVLRSDNLWIPLNWAIKTNLLSQFGILKISHNFQNILSRITLVNCPCKLNLVALYPFRNSQVIRNCQTMLKDQRTTFSMSFIRIWWCKANFVSVCLFSAYKRHLLRNSVWRNVKGKWIVR